jgi:hypothetical protein
LDVDDPDIRRLSDGSHTDHLGGNVHANDVEAMLGEPPRESSSATAKVQNHMVCALTPAKDMRR